MHQQNPAPLSDRKVIVIWDSLKRARRDSKIWPDLEGGLD
jgi:hypothetical protein